MKIAISFLFLLLAAQGVFADDQNCSNADGSWKFVQHTSNGGAMPLPGMNLPHWYINGVDTKVTSVDWVEGTDKDLSHVTTATWDTLVYTSEVDLGALGKQFMICSLNRYIGPPIP